MKFTASQVSVFLRTPRARQNFSALRTYLLVLAGIIIVYSVIFHLLMEFVEKQQHSWMTGFYWTLTVMSTLGFGDITFHSDIGRAFSMLVLLSGILLLLIMLPFTFIQFFYAPWLESKIRAQAPRQLKEGVNEHVILCREDSITRGLVRKLVLQDIPYVLLAADPAHAAQLQDEGLNVVMGDADNRKTYESVNVGKARLVVVNAEDPVNTNILLTVRSVNDAIPTVAIAEEEDSVDIFRLSGASYPLPLKILLGEQLATRAGAAGAHQVGRFKDLVIAEFLVHDTGLVGKSLRGLRLRERTGVNVVGIWDDARLQAFTPDQPLTATCVPVAIGTQDQIERLNLLLRADRASVREGVLVIGGGKVGISAAIALRKQGVKVTILDKNPALQGSLEPVADRVVIGNAADIQTIRKAGIEECGAVALTTNDDAQNIHLAVYCRRLCPDLTIVSRITRERNLEAIIRAGADFVLSYSSLGREYIMSYLMNREPIMVGEGADIFTSPVSGKLAGKTLAEAGIGARTGLVVIAIEESEITITNPSPAELLKENSRLVMLGSNDRWELFKKHFKERE